MNPAPRHPAEVWLRIHVPVSFIPHSAFRIREGTMNDPLASLPARAAQASLSQNEVARYSRHLIMPEVGVDGQKRLKAASVLLVGAGGLGSPLGLYLAAAGVGRLGIVDFDVVDFSNLQRQIIHATADVGRPKLHSARDRIKAINPEV